MNAQQLRTQPEIEASELRAYLREHAGPVVREVKRAVKDPFLRREVVRKAVVPFHVWRRRRERVNGPNGTRRH